MVRVGFDELITVIEKYLDAVDQYSYIITVIFNQHKQFSPE